ncbi:hypothetical protein [Nocardia sp. NPDC050175]|uniref:hypothetical protein n=1 Tax=Nocardia sp. NPDC050175 TaxID=3364317 RepID=UPI00379799FE
MRKSKVGARVVLAGLAFLLCGCSGASRASPSGDAETAAWHHSAAELLATATRAVDKHKSVSMDLDLGRESKGNCAFHAESPSDYAYRCTLTSVESAKPGRADFVLTPAAMYIEIPAGHGHSDRTSWLKIRPGADSGLFGIDAEQIRDLTVAEKMIPAAGATIVRVLPGTIDGSATTRYTLHIDTATAARDATYSEQRSQMKYLADEGISIVEVDFWVDEQDLPAKITVVTPIPKIGPLGSTVRYRDWGSPVRIDVPSDDQVGTQVDLGGR